MIILHATNYTKRSLLLRQWQYKRCNKAANYLRATYIFQSPSRVHNRLNLAFFPKIEHGFHDALGIGCTILLVQQVAQIQA